MQQESFSDLFLRYRFFFPYYLFFFSLFFSFCKVKHRYRTNLLNAVLFLHLTRMPHLWKRDIDIQIISAIVVTIEPMGFLERRRRAGRSRRRHRASRQRSPSLPLTNVFITLSSRDPSSFSCPPPDLVVVVSSFVYLPFFFPFHSYLVRPSNASLSRLEGRERLGPYETFLNGKESDAVGRSTPATGVAVAPRLNTLLPRKFQSYKADITVPQLHAYTIENAEKNETSQRQEHREGR